eukprot:SAG31_NODE_696_length_12754_cov_9.480759_8_plen_60_part_00
MIHYDILISVERVVSEVAEKFGRIDICVSNGARARADPRSMVELHPLESVLGSNSTASA